MMKGAIRYGIKRIWPGVKVGGLFFAVVVSKKYPVEAEVFMKLLDTVQKKPDSLREFFFIRKKEEMTYVWSKGDDPEPGYAPKPK